MEGAVRLPRVQDLTLQLARGLHLDVVLEEALFRCPVLSFFALSCRAAGHWADLWGDCEREVWLRGLGMRGEDQRTLEGMWEVALESDGPRC